MRKNYSSDDHDPGDEDPTERVKRALLEIVDPPFVEVPPRHMMTCGLDVSRMFAAWVTPGEKVRVRTPAQAASDAEDLL